MDAKYLFSDLLSIKTQKYAVVPIITGSAFESSDLILDATFVTSQLLQKIFRKGKEYLRGNNSKMTQSQISSEQP